MNEVELFFYFKNITKGKRFRTKFNEEQKIDELINHFILSDEYLKDINIIVILYNDLPINENDTFKNKNIKNNDIITIMCERESKEEIDNINKNKFIHFKYDKRITEHAHANLPNSNLNAIIDRTFDVYKSLKNEYILVFAYSENYINYSLKGFDIENSKIIYSKLNAHSERVFTCIHYLDEYNKRDLLITGSFDKTIKIWVIDDDFKLLYENTPDYNFKENTYLLSECLLFYNNSLYLITSAYEMYSKGYKILYYNIDNTQKFSSLKNSKDNTNYIETFYEDNIPLIIAANFGNIKIFDFKNKKLIKLFSDNNNNKINYLSCTKYNYSDITSFISSSSDGYLRIWNYDIPSNLIIKIHVTDLWLVGLELINNKYLLVGCYDGSLTEFDIESNYESVNIERNEYYYFDSLMTLKFINIKGNNYLFTHSKKGLIELWK